MRNAVRRLFTVRPPTRIVQVRVPAIIAGRRGLPVLLSAFAVVAAASTAATTTTSAEQAIAAPAGTTVLPPAAPPTYSYPGSSSEAGPGTPGGATAPGGTGLNGGQSGAPATSQLAAGGIPARAVQAYQAAAVAAGCGIPWTLVAAIGRVESDHGRFAGATLLADGRSDPPIVGIPLDGRPGVAAIKDTDGGRWDGDRSYDRAVGPMQFIPGTWATFGVDGDGNGKTDPFDIDDAAASAAKYLCKAGGDLSNEAGQRNAVYSYNRSTAYVDNVLALAALYAGHAPVDDSPAPGGTPRPVPTIAPPTLPEATIGDPPAAPGTSTSRPTPTPSRTTPKPRPTTPAPTTTHPSTPAPTTTQPSSPAPTTQPSSPPPSSTSPTPSPSPTCTPVPTPSSSGTNTPNDAASAAASPTTSPTPSPTPTGTANADATGTPTPSPSPTLPPCPS
jgi:Transglycosylase SLT domain